MPTPNLQLTGIVLDFDPDRATLYQDSARTTPATADGDPVGGLIESGPNALAGSQTTSGLRLTLKLNQLRGRRAVQCTQGAGNSISFGHPAAIDALASGSYTQIAVAYVNTVQDYLVLTSKGGVGTALWIYIGTDVGRFGAVLTDGSAVLSNSLAVVEYEWNASTLTETIRVNGAIANTNVLGSNPDFGAGTTNYVIGSSQQINFGFDGLIYRVILIDHVLSSGERDSMWKHLQCKYQTSTVCFETNGNSMLNENGEGGVTAGNSWASLVPNHYGFPSEAWSRIAQSGAQTPQFDANAGVINLRKTHLNRLYTNRFMILWEVTNDICVNLPPDETSIIANVQTWATDMRPSEGPAYVVYCYCLPRGAGAPANFETIRNAVNANEATDTTHYDFVINLNLDASGNPAMTNVANATDYADQIHPTPDAHIRMALKVEHDIDAYAQARVIIDIKADGTGDYDTIADAYSDLKGVSYGWYRFDCYTGDVQPTPLTIANDVAPNVLIQAAAGQSPTLGGAITNNSGNVTISGLSADTTAPTVQSVNEISHSPTSVVLNVTFGDDESVDGDSIGEENILITGPNGYSQFMPVDDGGATGATLTANYVLSSNLPTDSGTYTISLEALEVADTSGNFVAAQVLGTISIPFLSSGHGNGPLSHIGNTGELSQLSHLGF